MMTLLVKIFVKNKEHVSAPEVRKAYAELSSLAGIIFNLFLCTVKIIAGFFSNSIAVSADGFNNLSDAAASLVSLFGFKIAGYGGGNIHPFGHGRIEWIMGIFTSIAVLFMGIKLADSSMEAIANPQNLMIGLGVAAVLFLSVLVKLYMYFYNRKFAEITDSETLKATAADCMSDAAATFAVLLSAVISQVSGSDTDGYCGVLVSGFIIVSGGKSLWETLGRIMGKSSDQSMTDIILQSVKAYPEIVAVHNLMVHDYGFGYFVVSMNIDGYKKDWEQLYISANEISRNLQEKCQCDCFIQINYLVNDEILTQKLIQKIQTIFQKYSNKIYIDHFRLLESGSDIKIAFDCLYPADLQKKEAEICREIEAAIKDGHPQYYTTIKGIIRREPFRLCRVKYKKRKK